MKILHITQDMQAGGVEAIICNLLNEMIKTDDVTLCTIYPIDKDQVYEKKLDSRIKRLSLNKNKTGISFRILWNLFKLIKNGGYDVVHIHGWFYYFLVPVLLLHKKTKFFYTIHSDAKMENTPMDMRIIKFKRMCFQKQYVHPITISKPSQDSFTEFYSSDSKLIYNGVCKFTDEVRSYDFRITDKTRVFVHPARISSEKNQVVLVRVFERLIREGYDVVLLIAGQLRDKLIYAELEKYFNERIRYIGVRSDVRQLMAFSDGFCLPSIWEGLPVTLLEALSTGCVPICSPVGGIVEVVRHGENGFLSKSSSEDDYFETLKEVCNMPDDAFSHVKENCKCSFSRFDIVNTAANYLAYYHQICRS